MQQHGFWREPPAVLQCLALAFPGCIALAFPACTLRRLFSLRRFSLRLFSAPAAARAAAALTASRENAAAAPFAAAPLVAARLVFSSLMGIHLPLSLIFRLPPSSPFDFHDHPGLTPPHLLKHPHGAIRAQSPVKLHEPLNPLACSDIRIFAPGRHHGVPKLLAKSLTQHFNKLTVISHRCPLHKKPPPPTRPIRLCRFRSCTLHSAQQKLEISNHSAQQKLEISDHSATSSA